MSDLRTHIAAAIAKVVVDKNLDVRHHDLYDMADAVIAELGLEVERCPCAYRGPNCATRCVTGWKADDE